MVKVYYEVSKNGYATRCNTLKTVNEMLQGDTSYTVKTCYEKVEDRKTSSSPVRNAMLKQFGKAHPSLIPYVTLN